MLYPTGGVELLIILPLSASAGDEEQASSLGGAFDWVARLTSNRRHVFVASGLGTQLVALVFPPAR